jgi:transcription elongation factor Elf1
MEHEDLYLISEHLREGCTRCPFCYSYALDRSMVDETKIGVMLQQMTCRDCGADWTVEYEASRVKYGSKWYSRYEYWPTYTQVKNIKYQERFAAKHGIKNPWRPEVENLGGGYYKVAKVSKEKKRKSAIKRLIDYAKSLNW